MGKTFSAALSVAALAVLWTAEDATASHLTTFADVGALLVREGHRWPHRGIASRTKAGHLGSEFLTYLHQVFECQSRSHRNPMAPKRFKLRIRQIEDPSLVQRRIAG